jgi:hypothetical protein
MRTRLTERDITRIVRKALREDEEQVDDISAIFTEKGLSDSDVPDACKPKIENGQEVTDLAGCFKAAKEKFQVGLDIISSLESTLESKGIKTESRRYRRRF